MQYQIKTIKKVGISAYENELNGILEARAQEGWQVQQILGNPDQGYMVLFVKGL